MDNNQSAALTALPFAIIAVMMLFGLAMLALTIWLWAKIFGKSGNSPWLSLLLLIPLANLILLIWFALSTWPIENEVQRLKSLAGAAGAAAGVAKA